MAMKPGVPHLGDPIEAARSLLRDAERVVVLTGAGISAESGVPTFRGEDGLWKQFRAEELATPEAFARDARLVWEWYAWRRGRIAGCRPNAAHVALAELALGREGVRIVTQNVDGLHGDAARDAAAAAERAPDAALPIELHGSIHRARCTRCGVRTPLGAVNAESEETLPHCASCGALLRPDVVWFGEPLEPGILEDATCRSADADVALVVGTSALVWPAAGLAALTRRAGGAVIEVNPQATAMSDEADVGVRAKAAEAVPKIVK